jgi:hypothetical protein
MIAGCDYSTRFVDIVLLDEDTDAATWHRFPLKGQDAFDRARSVHHCDDGWPLMSSLGWEDVLAVGIEDPRGYGAGSLYRVQGAILAAIPRGLLVHPLIPSQWRKTVGLPGNASKDQVSQFVVRHKLASIGDGRDTSHVPLGALPMPHGVTWPQDACDAYCIALATRTLLKKVAA